MGNELVTRKIPQAITAGLSVSIALELVNNRPPEWQALLLLRGPKAVTIEATASDDGRMHHFRVPATETAGWPAGRYSYSLRATTGDGEEVVEIEVGGLTIKPDLAAMADGTDTRDHVRKVLDAIEAVIEKRATRDQERYTIQGRELWRTSIPDLLLLRDRYREELRRANAAAAGRSSLLGRTIRVGFRGGYSRGYRR